MADVRKVDILEGLFQIAGPSDKKPDSSLGERPSVEIGDLVRHFKELLAIEAGLPADTKLRGTNMMVRKSTESMGHIIKALRDALGDISDDTQSKAVYEDMWDALDRFDSNALPNAIDLYKIAGKAVKVVPAELFADSELYKTFLKEVAIRDDLHDKNNLLQAVLSFARNRDNKVLVLRAIELDPNGCKKFIIDNADWILEGASEEWIADIIIGVEEIRNDHARMDKLLKQLFAVKGFGILLGKKGDWKLGSYLGKWALSNLALVKSNHDLMNFVGWAADEESPQLIDELEKRKAWEEIVWIRAYCSSGAKLDYAQKVLDRNVDNIPTSLDFDSRRYGTGLR